MMVILNKDFFINVGLHVYCVYIVIGTLYFSYGSYIINQSIEKQIGMICSFIRQYTCHFNINDNLLNHNEEEMKEKDKQTEKENNKYIMIYLFSMLIFTYIIYKYYLNEFKQNYHLYILTIISTIFVESTFIYFFIGNYMNVDMNYLIQGLIK